MAKQGDPLPEETGRWVLAVPGRMVLTGSPYAVVYEPSSHVYKVWADGEESPRRVNYPRLRMAQDAAELLWYEQKQMGLL